MKSDIILAIGIGGFIGAVLRAYLVGLVNSNVSSNIPFGTLMVNYIGSFLLGLLFAMIENDIIINNQLKSMLTTGIMGALTTFSTFSIEVFFMLKNGLILESVIYIVLSVIGGVFFAGAGYTILNK